MPATSLAYKLFNSKQSEIPKEFNLLLEHRARTQQDNKVQTIFKFYSFNPNLYNEEIATKGL